MSTKIDIWLCGLNTLLCLILLLVGSDPWSRGFFGAGFLLSGVSFVGYLRGWWKP